jgi:hypothetical protein
MEYTVNCIYTKTGYLFKHVIWGQTRLHILEKINGLNRINNGVWVYFLPYEE